MAGITLFVMSRTHQGEMVIRYDGTESSEVRFSYPPLPQYPTTPRWRLALQDFGTGFRTSLILTSWALLLLSLIAIPLGH